LLRAAAYQVHADVAGSGPPKLARQRARVAESELEAAREELAALRAQLQVDLAVFLCFFLAAMPPSGRVQTADALPPAEWCAAPAAHAPRHQP
jgi:hypothetical protein